MNPSTKLNLIIVISLLSLTTIIAGSIYSLIKIFTLEEVYEVR